MIRSFCSTLLVCTKQELGNGILSVLHKQLLKLLWLILMLQIWKQLALGGRDLGMLPTQLFTYTLLSCIFRQQMDIITPATSSLWEGSVVGRYTRPMPVFASFVAETIGKWWVPTLLFFSIPVWLAAPLLGVNPLPASPSAGLFAFFSLALSASLGFAMDFLFASIAIRLKNACWAATQIRESILTLLSGALIPFAMMPKPVAQILGALPFASLSSAPLGIYVGIHTNPVQIIGVQIVWNLVFWVLAVVCYRKSEERMISYGG